MKRSLSLLVVLLSIWALASCQEKSKQSAILVPGSDSLPANLKAINTKIAAEPGNPDLYIERATICLDRQDGQQAFSDASKAITFRGGVSRYYVVFSDACLMMGKVKECRAALETAVSLDKKSTEPLLKLAELSLYFKDYSKVFDYTQQVQALDDNNAKAFFIRGFALKEKGDTVAAIKNFRQAVDADQKYFDAYIQLGLLHAAKRSKLSADYYKTALTIKPKSIEAYYDLGIYYQENGAYNEAMDAYRAIIAIDSKYKHAYFNMGYIHMFYLRVYSEGAKYFTKAIDTDPNFAEAYYNRAYCRELMGDETNARLDYNKAMAIRPNYKLAMDGLNRLDHKAKMYGTPK